jgi:hypothetical protein
MGETAVRVRIHHMLRKLLLGWEHLPANVANTGLAVTCWGPLSLIASSSHRRPYLVAACCLIRSSFRAFIDSPS